MNRVTVIIEAEHDGNQSRAEVSRCFSDCDYNRDEVLRVFEDALRGAGYVCEPDTLEVVPES